MAGQGRGSSKDAFLSAIKGLARVSACDIRALIDKESRSQQVQLF